MTEPNQSGDESQNESTMQNEGGEDLSNTTQNESQGQSSDKEREGGEYRDVILESLEGKLKLGKTTLEEIEGKTPWAAAELRKRQSDDAPKEPDTEAQMEARIMERLEVKTLQTDIMSAATKEQADLFNEEFAKYKDSLGEKEATLVAEKIAGIDRSTQARSRRGLATPSLGSAGMSDKPRITAADRRLAKLMGSTPETVAKHRIAVEG